MALEARLVRSAAGDLDVRRTGMGPRRSREAGRALAASRGAEPIRLLVIIGFAGGLEPGALAGQVVVADELRARGGERVVCGAASVLAAALERRGVGVRRGVIACAPRPVLGRERARLRDELGAIAADMESLWLAQAAHAQALGVVRVLADAPSEGVWRPWRGVQRLLAARGALKQASSALGAWARTEAPRGVGDGLGLCASAPMGADAPGTN